MIEFSVPAQILNAARQCVAGKDDASFFLSGVCFFSKLIAGANGHIAFVHEFKEAIETDESEPLPDQGLIIEITNAPPAKARRALIKIEGTIAVIKYFEASDPCFFAVDAGILIDGKFPDLGRILEARDSDQVPVEEISFNIRYLAMIDKVFSKLKGKYGGVTLKFYGKLKATFVEQRNIEQGELSTMLIMPIKGHELP